MTEYKVGDPVQVVTKADGDYLETGTVESINHGKALPYVVRIYDYRKPYAAEHLAPAESTTADQPAPDLVSHPSHYTDGVPTGVEVIDIIRAHMLAGGTWETANALKYILRHPLKDNPTQDIAKATQYLTMWTQQQETA